mgnify:CR=1 FL=1
MENRFIRAEEVADELGVSKPYAYKLIRQLNEELKDKASSPSQAGQPPVFQRTALRGQKGRELMPVFKDEARGTWYVMVRYQDWTGERKQKCKRGFATKREAQEWERSFQMQTSGDLDMTFEAFTELYTKDMKPRLKENTWLTKENIIQKKILPYFGKRKIARSPPRT